MSSLRRLGFDDGDIAEIIANVALNIFTNYFNHVAETDIDFPRAEAIDHAPATCPVDQACNVN